MSDLHPKLVAFDLDGTLAESKQRMSAEVGELFAQLLKKVPVAILSGGGWPQFEKQFFPSLPPDVDFTNLFIFPDNAAQCFVWRDGWKPQYDHALTEAEKEHILAALHEALNEVGLEQAPVRIWGERIEDRGAEIAFSALGQEAPVAEKQKWHDAHDDQRKLLHESLNRKLPEFANALGGLTTIDITRKGITKAYGILRLVELTHIPVSQMLYVGDALDEGGNDSVVIETGIRTHQVFGPEETAGLITALLK